jgi:uncharacterized membrane protein
MGTGHGHSETGSNLRVDPGTRYALIGLVALIGLATLAAAVALWPRGAVSRTAAVQAVQQDTVSATVVGVQRRTCAGTSDDRLADGSVPATVTCAAVKVRLGAGPDAGKVVAVDVAGPVVDEGLAPGVSAVVARYPGDKGDIGAAGDAGDDALSPAASAAPVYAWVDFDRGQPMWLLAAVFVLVVLGIARFRGLAALAGVGAGFAMILVFLLPALRRGENPAAVTLVGTVAVMLVVLYASHGISAKTTTALFGTVGALGLTAGAAVWAASAAHLDGQTGEDALSLSQLVGAGTISAAVISGLVLAGLGVLNDVTVTQASAVWELRAAAPHLPARALVTRGMRIGRDHLASTVYTIAFVYAGVSLPVLLLIQVYDRPFTEVITSAPIAQDVVGVLVGGIGLALAIPLTTLVAALVASRGTLVVPSSSAPPVPVPAPEAGEQAGEQFEEGLLVRRRRRRNEWPDHSRLDRPAVDDHLEATDWSSW